ncbi:glyoxalase superfamily protein [Sphingobium sp. SA916]|uniref:glyoxalase superfamily protein n=1 Tax=Sphingobium sp. SA916 TaxID=1851207 RepID=UPI001559F842|nr:glyoxalase superfamily protein [Sphingobium sp. SA916]
MTQFTTINGLKRAAKRLKKEQGIKHADALERVARDAGFRNYHDAQKALSTGSEEQ